MGVKKVFTFKSGYFVFSDKFSFEELQPLIIEARILYETVKDLPILPELASALEQELIRRSIFGTAAIEGNPLTEEAVGLIISDTESINVKKRAEREIANLKTAYDLIKGWQTAKDPFKVTEDIIKEFHALITRKVDVEYNNPGHYRNHIVKVGDRQHGGIYTPPKCLPDIEKLMNEFSEWINGPEALNLYPPIRAALSHYYIGLIHPFGDGNGRTARIIEAAILKLSGIKYVPIMLSNFYYKNIDDYFWAFSNSIKNKENNITPFIKFALQGFVESLKEIKERIIYIIRKFTLRDYYDFLKKKKHITLRQHDLLVMLLDYNKPFNIKDLFGEAPFEILYRNVGERTARRDLKKLSEQFLNVTEDNKYILNWRALE
ncbi:MAG: Fic family protein [Deltaproteobacteria bacterium]|nr:Fic family protein [Deltaproteobacteria bacterium]